MERKLLLKLCVLFLAFSVSVQAGDRKNNATLPVTTTQIQSAYCGQVLAAINTTIIANIVTGASSYRFKISNTLPNGSVQEQYVTNSTRVFTLTQMASYGFAKTYSIQVATCISGVWQPYGASCTLYSPSAITAIQTSQCGITVSSISDIVYANNIVMAPGYRFRVTNFQNPSEVYVIDRALREFRMNLFPCASGQTYTVEVAVRNFDGTYLPYGPVCSVTAPILFTKIQASYCGRFLGAFSDYIYADNVPDATGYRFKVTNMSYTADVQYLDRALRSFTMSMLSNIQYNTSYKIEVAIKDTHGDYLPYGPFCVVYTPLLPVPKIQLSQCEMICTSMSEMMFADEYPNATVYRFRLENPLIGYSHYIDRVSRCYNLNMFSGLQANTAYTVKVAVKVNGTFTGFGKACDVTTPLVLPATRIASGSEKTEDINDAPFMPRLYPNPFSEYFSIDAALQAAAEVSVKVYDMTGRLLDVQHLKAADLAALRIGQEYPPGVYNVIVGAGDETKTLRVVKR